MRNIKLTIEYNGTNFCGFQIQPKGKRTVQGEIQNTLKIIFKKNIKIIGSGRTDSGVHATAQVANFKISSSMPTKEIISAINANIDNDITVLEAADVSLDFHSQYNIKSKTYRYTILNRATRCSLEKDFCLLHNRKLNVKHMKDAAKLLIGQRDFKSFQSSDKTRKPGSTIRTIKNIKIKKSGDFIYIDIEANGFLYKMVRNIVGTLLGVGSGRLEKGSIRKILKAKNRNTASPTAPAKGLCLIKAEY
ncbi:MAG: tRNA pseudouridine(38-40) synthase TruA [Candidatus Zapsychrus exili]|nr:tRNA pseudouridine(38-40) synthase TruA [Candidatus Zapsychrus exili]